MASAAAASDVSDGPVLSLINKRIRNLRKKLNRIVRLEKSLAQGTSAIKNEDQEELLKSKPTIVAAINELENFRQPLSIAVDEEINLAIQHRQIEASETNRKVEDLLSLIYVGSMFDVKSESDFRSIMLTRTHEKNCYLMYDMLGKKDLDLISMMGSLLISRPKNSNAAMRKKLDNIMGSDFMKIMLKIKPTYDVAAGSYRFQVPVQTYKMHGDVSEDLIYEIFTRLPLKSVLRFRTLSKLLSRCITSRDFIRMHTFRSPQKILIKHCLHKKHKHLYTIHTGDQLPITRLRRYAGIKPIKPRDTKNDYISRLVGSCNGIICIWDSDNSIHLWNPSFRRELKLPDCLGGCSGSCPHRCSCGAHRITTGCIYGTGIGIGFDSITDDFKIVSLPECGGTGESTYIYTMKTAAWCAINSPTPLFHKVTSRGCFVNGSLHWLVNRRIIIPELDDVYDQYILTFDLSTHVFGMIVLPKPGWRSRLLTIIQGSLAVVSSKDGYTCIWVMREYNNTVSWEFFKSKRNRFVRAVYSVLQVTSNNSDLLLFNTETNGYQVYDLTVGEQSKLWDLDDDSYICQVEIYVESLQLFHMRTPYHLLHDEN
ncbi:hypothetical protein LXL04_016929 [Taraxacum kok-saghyz]